MTFNPSKFIMLLLILSLPLIVNKNKYSFNCYFKFLHNISNYEIGHKFELIIIVFILLYYTNSLGRTIILLFATFQMMHLLSLQIS